MTSPLRHLLALVLGLCALGTVAFAAPVKFDIPAQPAPAALKTFIQQSGVQVVFNADDLKDVQANEVKGEFEPPAALAALLKGTGFTASQRSGGLYVITREKGEAAVGAVKGSLLGADGRGLSGALVVLRETSQSTTTDRYGNYVFDGVPAGTYILVATMDGYQPLHITDIVVRGGRELTLAKESMRKAVGDLVNLAPYVVRAEQVTELERYEVVGSRMKPFVDGNVDIPRTINDVQPYYILDSKTITQSGALNVDELLKNQLSMNSTAMQNSQIPGPNQTGSVNILGNVSKINLRGVGTDKTLILVNGRRVANIAIGTDDVQPDVNGIPLAAIERVEVLPTSASGIYGGGAIGGVINLILKRDYHGGELRLSYDNTFKSDAPNRTASLLYGMSLEGGKTQLMFSGQFSDSDPLLFQDRKEIYLESLRAIQANAPTYLFRNLVPILGATPNIASRGTPFITVNGQTTGQNLTLKDGRSLNSPFTYVSAGTTPTTAQQALGTSLLANAGSLNVDLPASNQQPTGLLQPLAVAQTTRSFQANLRRQMGKSWEMFVDVGYYHNSSESSYNPLRNFFTVSSSNPTNPFNQNVHVKFPTSLSTPIQSDSLSRTISIGAIVHLPGDWTAEMDVTRSTANFSSSFQDLDGEAFIAAVNAGAINLFSDTITYPQGMDSFIYHRTRNTESKLDNIALRGAGPIKVLPWGDARGTVGLEHRVTNNPENLASEDYPISTVNSFRQVTFERKQTTDSVYGEVAVPLVRRGRLSFVDELEAQFAGRSEWFTADSGTYLSQTFYNQNPVVTTYNGPTKNGQPFREKARYSSNNATVGFKYVPLRGVTLRVSYSTAFLPPNPTQLVRNPALDPLTTSISDPQNNSQYSISTLSGGNPDLKPQNSKSWNIGLIAEPFEGFRADLEYYSISQFDAIGGLSAQSIINNETVYPTRVHRNSAGLITDVDTSLLNLFKRQTAGLDVTLTYSKSTSIGSFDARMMGSRILRLTNQFDSSLPDLDYLGAVNEDGAAKYKANASLGWAKKKWSVRWTTRYFGRYRQQGAAGSPVTIQFGDGSPFTTYISPQGSDTIPSQIYHDLVIGWSSDEKLSPGDANSGFVSRMLRGTGVQVGLRNVFNTMPPLDAFRSDYFYRSPFGDVRMQSYWVSLKKSF